MFICQLCFTGATSYPSVEYENPRYFEGNMIDLSSLLGLQPKMRQDQTAQALWGEEQRGCKPLVCWEFLPWVGASALCGRGAPVLSEEQT